ncbi:hypothetical protein WICMUC_004163 [Wickerhamomyces mucosus]|uniref:STAS domain-containing protein n=1 Tax=Wickerhamomyces mucosus TaxID=1378264 RepID=A0A9P8PJ33_9ASCO|nr:hypothetical protein WICMUC_004163 [Wickerhamomyces mucosus]
MSSESSHLLNKRNNLSQNQLYESLKSSSNNNNNNDYDHHRSQRNSISNLKIDENNQIVPGTPHPASVFSNDEVLRYSNSQNPIQLTSTDLDWKQRLPYYLPCYSWLPTYTLDKFLKDFIAGCSLASFQIPLALSYATSVAHVPALCGLYSLAIPPIIYAIFGSVPQMIVGPESAIALVIGQAVEPLVGHNKEIDPVDLVSVLTSIGAFYLLGAGLCRFGFLDNVLSRALLRGFISAVGIVMIINSCFDGLGIKINHDDVPTHFHSPFEKFLYLLQNLNYLHKSTSIISSIGFIILLGIGFIKTKLIRKGYTNAVFFPEILTVVIVSAILSEIFDWKSIGVEIVGKIQTQGFTYKSPFTIDSLPLYKELMSSGFLAATLGLFESTTAAKSLGSTYDLPISSNRELVALGAINLIGGALGALPAFGGYGRSRINALSGAQTTFSGAIMGGITLLTIFYLLTYIENLPKCILSDITAIVGLRLLEETPSDILFHWRAKGWSELITFCLTLFATLFYSVEAGIILGVGYSVIIVIKNSTKSRIQILGRLPGTNTFLNADDTLAEEYGDFLEEIEGCLIVKIAEPLTFSNTGDLKIRLLRLERYGSTHQHPAAPRSREEHMNKNILFELKGMTYFDSSAAQIFYEILQNYKSKGHNLYLIRVPTRNGIRERLNNSGITGLSDGKFYSSIDEVLQLIDEQRQNNNTGFDVGGFKDNAANQV